MITAMNDNKEGYGDEDNKEGYGYEDKYYNNNNNRQ